MGMDPEKASPGDAEEVMSLIHRCREAMRGTGMEQWPDFYPDIDVVRRDIGNGNLWVRREEGRIIAAATMDDDQPGEYSGIDWRYGEPYVCVHRLAVDPSRQRKGIARRFMTALEAEAAGRGTAAVRLDSYSRNRAANSLYEGLGYRKRGTIHLPKKPEEYNCYEKAVSGIPPGSFRSLVEGSRSVRRFREDRPVSRDTLEGLVDLARLAPSGANRQPLKFMLSFEPERNALIFPHLAWAGYLKDWDGPAEGERPAAYIVILGDREVSGTFGTDHGIAAQTIMLGAAASSLAGCIIGAVDRPALAAALGIPERYEILYVIALGHPAEKVVLEEATEETGIRYWRSEDGVHHVPKRPLSEIIFEP